MAVASYIAGFCLNSSIKLAQTSRLVGLNHHSVRFGLMVDPNQQENTDKIVVSVIWQNTPKMCYFNAEKKPPLHNFHYQFYQIRLEVQSQVTKHASVKNRFHGDSSRILTRTCARNEPNV